MDLGLTEAQQMLRNSAREFLEAECTEAFVRAMEEDERGYTPESWQKIAENGWLGLIFPKSTAAPTWSFWTCAFCWRRPEEPCSPARSSPPWCWAA